LLLPKRRLGDPVDAEYRPDRILVGSREFDATKVGFFTEGYQGFELGTSTPGNDNEGHEYAAGITPQPNGRPLPALTEEDRWDLVEYMKSL